MSETPKSTTPVTHEDQFDIPEWVSAGYPESQATNSKPTSTLEQLYMGEGPDFEDAHTRQSEQAKAGGGRFSRFLQKAKKLGSMQNNFEASSARGDDLDDTDPFGGFYDRKSGPKSQAPEATDDDTANQEAAKSVEHAVRKATKAKPLGVWATMKAGIAGPINLEAGFIDATKGRIKTTPGHKSVEQKQQSAEANTQDQESKEVPVKGFKARFSKAMKSAKTMFELSETTRRYIANTQHDNGDPLEMVTLKDIKEWVKGTRKKAAATAAGPAAVGQAVNQSDAEATTVVMPPKAPEDTLGTPDDDPDDAPDTPKPAPKKPNPTSPQAPKAASAKVPEAKPKSAYELLLDKVPNDEDERRKFAKTEFDEYDPEKMQIFAAYLEKSLRDIAARIPEGKAYATTVAGVMGMGQTAESLFLKDALNDAKLTSDGKPFGFDQYLTLNFAEVAYKVFGLDVKTVVADYSQKFAGPSKGINEVQPRTKRLRPAAQAQSSQPKASASARRPAKGGAKRGRPAVGSYDDLQKIAPNA